MVCREQAGADPATAGGAAAGAKKNGGGLLGHIQQLWQRCAPAFRQQRVFERAQTLALSGLLCLGRHTITGLLTTAGRQDVDWTADYRLLARQRLPLGEIFAVLRRAVLRELPPPEPLLAVVDDTLLPRSGTHMPGVAWRRDPLGPHFQTNLIRAQRFLQISAALPAQSGVERMIPIAFEHAPTPAKPDRRASPQQWREYRQQSRQSCISLRARQSIAALREALDRDEPSRPLLVAFDGGFTNHTVLSRLPERTVAIGRIRKDARLYRLAEAGPGRGRRRCYGDPAPTPEQIRSDESHPWQTLFLPHHGTQWQIRYKRVTPLLWRSAGARCPLQVIALAPASYRRKRGDKLLYRQPAYLVCTDPNLPAATVIAAYLRRWAIEVNFRDEKTLLGAGQPQVRNPHSTEAAPALAVASYAMLLLAAYRASASGTPAHLPPPAWQRSASPPFATTRAAQSQLRAEVWGQGLLALNLPHFAAPSPPATKPPIMHFPLAPALLYASA